MLGGWWVTNMLQWGGPVLLTAWIIWVVLSIMLHELAHGWAAISRGDRTPIDTGHMTWNPLVHMGFMSILMFALLGIAYGLMPIDPSRMKGRYAEAFVAFCGPLMNFILAGVCILGGGVAAAFVGQEDLANMVRPGEIGQNASIAGRLMVFAGVGAALNLLLALFNLIPLPPLDGSRILANVWSWYRNFMDSDGGRFVSILLFVFAFFIAGGLIVPMASISIAGMMLISQLLKSLGIGA